MALRSLSWLITLTLAGGVATTVGCGSSDDGNGSNPGEVDNGFESDDPSGQSNSRGASSSSGGATDTANAGSPAPNDPSSKGGDEAARAVEEADIVQQDGNRLYALSQYGGLAIIDISDPDHMKLLGRKRTEGMPFEMYVKNGKAYVMLNDFGRWVATPGGSYYGQWIQTSELVTLDLANPAAITEVSHYDVPGTIADSRVVGDALYLVTYENGYCWGCGQNQATVITSFGVGNGTISKVDQLSFQSPNKNYSSWQRSVSATNQHLYVAGPEWSWDPNSGTQSANSIIQVVDITDPAGHLVKGADVTVAGQINSRWQMDEYNGILRVVSQYNNGWGGSSTALNPKVQTFTVTSASNITKLGETELVMPHPEQLQSVRFDGARGYAITSERKDPLYTIDLADPAHPAQAAALTLPGYIFHMEPRGDRLVGFGYDDTTWNSSLAVSLFDVTDLKNPQMLSRVSFGDGWGSLAEDQDRMHKVVRVLDDQGLILVPFASYGRWENNTCSKPQSGIQIIDYSKSGLVKRGLAPQYGMPRRAMLANNRLLAMSDRNVSSFDITNKDAPAKKNELDLSNPAYRMVEVKDQIASITSDWWSGEVMLSLTPKATADDAAVTGKVSLASLADPNSAYCGNNTGWASWYDARLFANGNYLYVSVPVYTWTNSVSSGKVVVAAIDVSNPLEPKLAGKTELKLADQTNGYYGYGWMDGYYYWNYYGGIGGSLVGSGQQMVQLGSKLAYLEIDNEYSQYTTPKGNTAYTSTSKRRLHVVDFADPNAPAVTPAMDLGNSNGAAPLHLLGSKVLTSRWSKSPTNPNKVRFFMDQIDIGGVSPVRLPSINTPGSILAVDASSNHLVTVDYKANKTTAADWQSCQQALGWRAWFDYDTNDCISVDRSFKLSNINGSSIHLAQTFVPPSQNIGGVEVADDRIYVTRYARYDYSNVVYDGSGNYQEPTLLEDGGLWAIGGVKSGNLSIVSQFNGGAQWPLAASGTKVALYTDNGLSIWDTASPNPVLVKDVTLRGWGYANNVLMHDNDAVASLGEFGLQTVHY